ncbi:signal peptidase II [Aquifex aeolicus]|uniref:Lipoprotein signal peptidase n=1 Tax=Aquifex aeolicus (strain VF5) TaxID=224324 RepID=LSPA_AQUAE|nr:signal peptidase II [Aquifex aeolicus]O67692.1 RecName: Full=Lipoprotein signal peptidase; AltName: Full=Prolipoprotein signal peptidase; AltName: Full=Signal peptidase II; Short=SPase II [Aquifex aeolicus VF5]AAC07652.1 lipoprotein signal peptidase [Aquifex aeolicus VF5]
MENFLRKTAWLYLSIAVSVFLLDIITKNLAEKLFTTHVEVFPFLEFYLIYNKGVAFGLLSELPDPLRLPLLLITPVIALIITFLYALYSGDRIVAISMGLIGGGALGNLYDRLFLGMVRDFIHLHIGEYYWPAFNIADASISIGIALLILKYFFTKPALKNLVNRTR